SPLTGIASSLFSFHLAFLPGSDLANRRMYTSPPLPHLVHGGGKMSAELIEFSNALAQATERAAASAVAVNTEARGSTSRGIWRLKPAGSPAEDLCVAGPRSQHPPPS